jgi:phosphoribosylformimino-5-aminoimidazole carboxamide ribonucleotide (ProFAR) isomerase
LQSNEFKNRFWWWIEVGCRFENCFESGANQITGGSIAVKNRAVFEKWIATFGADKIILVLMQITKK